MTNEGKAQQIIGCNRANCLECGGRLSVANGCTEFKRIMAMADFKDNLPISELGGWHTETPTEDGKALLETKSKHEPYVVVGWSSYDKCFYDSNEQKYTKWERWKRI